MKINKILIVLLPLFISVFTFTGCEEEVLDKEPRTVFSEKDVWNDITLVKQYVNSTYNGLGNWGIAPHWNGRRTLPGVATTMCFNPWDGFGTDVINQGTISPENLGVWYNTWSSKYTYIRKCNMFLNRIDDVEAEEEVKRTLKGEVKYLRARFYYDLIRYWGGVPLITEVFELDDDFGVSRTPYEEVVDWIAKELDEARAMVPKERTSDEWGKVNKGACLALKSNLLLYANSKLHDPSTEPNGPLYDYSKNTWQEVADAAKAVIDMPQYSLQEVDNWRDYTNIFLEPNSEMIFVKANHPDYKQGGLGNVFEHVNGSAGPGFRGWSNNYPTHNIVQDFQMENGMDIQEEGSGYDSSVDSIYKNRELRFYADILYNGAYYQKREMEFFLPGGKDSHDHNQPWNASDTRYNLRKGMNPEVDIASGKGDQPWIYLRLAEMYLNYAEAQYEMGNEAEARQYLNTIRNRVNLPDVTTSGEELFKDIQHERKIELFIEHHRFFDVRRWMIADKSGNEDILGINWKKVNENGELDPEGELTYEVFTVQERTFKDKMYYLPIPVEEINKSGLKQNAGY